MQTGNRDELTLTALIQQAYNISDIHKKYMQKCKISGNYSISALQALQFGV